MPFESERLVTGCWSDVGTDAMFAVYGDPEVTRWLSGPDQSLEASESRIASYQSRHDALQQLATSMESEFVFGIWPVWLKSTSEYAGTLMMKPLPDVDGNPSPDIEVGWHFGQRFWGQGLATEAGKMLLKIGFESSIPELHAVMLPENVASQRVAQRLGMKYLGQTNKYYGLCVEHFKITRSDWTEPTEP